MKDVEKKMKNYLNFDGNDNPEFPKPIGKGEKVARTNTEKQDEEVAKNFAGLQNLHYDIEPSKEWRDRQERAINGHSTMGNAPMTEDPKMVPSNGADKGKVSQKTSNVVKDDKAGKKLKKQIKDRSKDKEERELYNKQAVPVKTKNLNEEIERMRKISGYNKKTQ